MISAVVGHMLKRITVLAAFWCVLIATFAILVTSRLRNYLVGRGHLVADTVPDALDSDDALVGAERAGPLPVRWFAMLVVASYLFGLTAVSLSGWPAVASARLNLITATFWIPPTLILIARERHSSFIRRYVHLPVNRWWIFALAIAVVQIALVALGGLALGDTVIDATNLTIGRFALLLGVLPLLALREVVRWQVFRSFGQRRTEFVAVALTWLFFLLAGAIPNSAPAAAPFLSFAYVGGFLLPLLTSALFLTYLNARAGPVAAFVYAATLSVGATLTVGLDAPWQLFAAAGGLIPAIALIFLDEREAHERRGWRPSERLTVTGFGTALLLCWFLLGSFGVSPSVVQGSSMEPYLKEGDLVITRPIDPEKVRIGDVIRYREDSYAIMHRVIGYAVVDGETMLVTRGDNTTVIDSLVPFDDVEGILVFRMSKVASPWLFVQELFDAPPTGFE